MTTKPYKNAVTKHSHFVLLFTQSSFLLLNLAKYYRSHRSEAINRHHIFQIATAGPRLQLKFAGLDERFDLPGSVALLDHLTLKLLLNMHSTLVIGRLGRFESNLMTWVSPSNGKLIDRAARYTQILLGRRGYGDFTYDEIVRAQFACKNELSPNESIVHMTMRRLVSAPT